ncbi:hypothetical protein B566_EDAN011871 [Ephemera danica]|nr:hypothetical protein B566_EDAN011871 [Ephemera danica]
MRVVMLIDVHVELPYSSDVTDIGHFVQGSYQYFHYGCDGFNDKGWGCGYRTLQTLCSWIHLNNHLPDSPRVPSIPDIQDLLITIGDKPESFRNSMRILILMATQRTEEHCKVLDHGFSGKAPKIFYPLHFTICAFLFLPKGK